MISRKNSVQWLSIPLCLLAYLCCPAISSAETASIPLKELPQNTRYAIWGDSITEVTIYPRYVEAYLLACAGRKDITVCTYGHSGETAGGFQSRGTDQEPFHPTLVSIYWGMNDTQYTPYTDEKGANFDKTTRQTLATLAGKGITQRIVVAPSYVDDLFGDEKKPEAFFNGVDPKGQTVSQAQNNTLCHFRDLGRAAAVETGAAFADVHNRMKDAYLAAEKALGPKYSIGIHVSPNGALMIAHEILKTLTCDGNIGEFKVDMKGQATASAGHTVVNFADGKLTLDSSKYPFCYNYDPNNSQGPNCLDSILPYLPFSQELNRLTLTVINLDAPSANVTWGSTTKQFTSDQLAKGINLVEQFPNTPFDTTFAKVMAAVNDKQDYENYMIKGTSNFFGNDNGGNIDMNMVAVHGEKDAALKAVIVPVRHTIVIVPTGKAGPAGPVITGTMAAYPIVGRPFTYQISTLGTATKFAADDLPKGLSLNATNGQITGTPTETGMKTVSVSATNDKGTDTTKLTLTVANPIPERIQITSPKTADATVGTPFSYQITTNVKASHYFATTPSDKGTIPPASSLPAGITYDTATGIVSGTPTTAGTFTIQVAAMNDAGVVLMPVKVTIKDK